MEKQLFNILLGIVILISIVMGKGGAANTSSEEACPTTSKGFTTGWNHKVYISEGWLFNRDSCIWTHSVHKGGIPISASGYITNDPTHTLFQGKKLHVSNNGWKTTTESTGEYFSHACEMSAHVYFTLTRNGTTWNDSHTKITSCTYFICNSAISCEDTDCSTTPCWSPDGEPTITLTPVTTK